MPVGLIALSDCTMPDQYTFTAEGTEKIERMLGKARDSVEWTWRVPVEWFDTLLARLNTKPAPVLKLCVLVRPCMIGVPHAVQHAPLLLHDDLTGCAAAPASHSSVIPRRVQLLATAGPSGLSPGDLVDRAHEAKLPGNWVGQKRVDAIRTLLRQYPESFRHFDSWSVKRWSLACFDLPAGASQDDWEAVCAGQLCPCLLSRFGAF